MSDTHYDGECCVDCLYLIANGDTPPEMDEDATFAYLAEIDRRNDGYDVVPSSWPFEPELIGSTEDDDEVPDDGGTYEVDEYGDIYRTDWTDEDRYYGTPDAGRFSWSSCDVCGSGLGGDRYPVAFFPADS